LVIRREPVGVLMVMLLEVRELGIVEPDAQSQ
jgi:hypothetical protein